MLRFLAIVLACISCIQGGIIDGQCPEVTVVENFELTKYVGRWYEHFTYPRPQETGKCNTGDYYINKNGTMGIRNILLNTNTGELEYANGNARPVRDPSEAKFYVNLDIGSHTDANYWILETDYKTYSVVWSCTQLENKAYTLVWLLGRERTFNSEIMEKWFNVLNKFKIDETGLKQTDQTDCPRF